MRAADVILAFSGLPIDDVQQIFVVLGVLYTVECAWWLYGESRRMFTRPCHAWSDLPGWALVPDGRRLSASVPLPWVAGVTTERFAFPFDHERILVPTLDPATGEEPYVQHALDELGPVRAVGRTINAGSLALRDVGTEAVAAATARRLERVRAAAHAERPRVAEEILAEIWSQPAAAARWRSWWRSSALLRNLGGVLTVAGLLLGPLVHATTGSLPAGLPLAFLAVFLALWAATALAGLVTERAALPAEARGLQHVLISCVTPAGAMRLFDTLGRDVLAGYEPLVTACAVRGTNDSTAVVEAWLRDAVHPLRRTAAEPADPVVQATLERYRERTARLARAAVATAGLDADALLAPPAGEPDVTGYCPRCCRGFTGPATRCTDCGLPVLPNGPRRGPMADGSPGCGAAG